MSPWIKPLSKARESLGPRLESLTKSPGQMAIVFICITFLLYGNKVIEGGFVGDDCSHLAYAATHTLLEAFTDRQAMLDQSYAHITPMLSAAFMLAVGIFGLNDHGHYLLSVSMILLTGFATWFFIRQFVNASAALAGSLLWLTATEVNHVVSSLSTIQYALGLLFTVICLLSISKFSRGSRLWPVIATVTYAMACLSKEIYVPIVVVAWFWPRFSSYERLCIALPMTCIAVLYTFLRVWLFDGIGGYSSLYDPVDLGQRLLTGLDSLRKLLIGNKPTLWAAKVAVGIVLVHGLIWGRRPAPLFMLVCIFCLVAPIAQVLALGNLTSERLSYLIAWCLAMFAVWTANGSPVRIGLLFGAICFQTISMLEQVPVDNFLSRHKIENRYLVDSPSNAAPLFTPRSPWIVYLNSTSLARSVIQGDRPPMVVSSIDGLTDLSTPGAESAVHWDPQCKCLQPLGTSIWNLVEAERDGLLRGSGIEWSGEIRLERRRERHYTLSWQINSHTAQHSIEIKNLGHFDLPNSGSRSFGRDTTFDLPSTIHVRARADLASGAILQTPWMEMSTVASSSVTWGKRERD